MESFRSFVALYPVFSMLVFTSIGFLLRGLRRINITAVQRTIEDIECALEDEDIERVKCSLERLKSGFGL